MRYAFHTSKTSYNSLIFSKKTLTRALESFWPVPHRCQISFCSFGFVGWNHSRAKGILTSTAFYLVQTSVRTSDAQKKAEHVQASLVSKEWFDELPIHKINFSTETFYVQMHGLHPKWLHPKKIQKRMLTTLERFTKRQFIKRLRQLKGTYM